MGTAAGRVRGERSSHLAVVEGELTEGERELGGAARARGPILNVTFTDGLAEDDTCARRT